VFQALYLDLRSPIHRLDPRVKILGLVLLSALPFVFNHPAYTATVAALVVGVGILGGTGGNLLRFRYLYLLFFCVNFLLWQLQLSGTGDVAQLGPIHLSEQGLMYGLAVAIRSITVLLIGVIFVSCTQTEDLTIGLTKLRLPYAAAFVISMAVRLVPTFVAAVAGIMEAQTARGFTVDSRNPVKRLRQVIPILIPLIMYALRHASLMSLALEARGFTPRARRTAYAEPVFARTDMITLAALILLLTGCLLLRFTGHGTVLPGRI
jgi:energy-coupling factor transport system permease protein